MVRVVKPVKQTKPQVKAKRKLRNAPANKRSKRGFSKTSLSEYQVTWC